MNIVKFRTRVGISMNMKSQKTIKFLFLVILCMSLLVFLPLETKATNVDGSAIIFPSDALTLQVIDINIWANGTLGAVQGASVLIIA